MVEARLTLEAEVQEIFTSIDNEQNFLLSGGAGSGKTYSLVQVIREVIHENPSTKVACMTYTNAAVKEIEERVNHQNLNVSTIHDFLWDNIKHFQKELKSTIISLANEDNSGIFLEEPPIPETYFDYLETGIQYKEYLRLKDGIISHDEILIIANRLFDNYPKLSSIVKDKYPFIFVDEYQDTNAVVVDIFLTHFKKSRKTGIIGFFGDAMQSIYDDGIGNLDIYKGETQDTIKEVKKTQNRRSPRRIIALANLLRTDGIVQEPSRDEKAPNMSGGKVKEGRVLFIHSSDSDILRVKQYLTDNFNWNFNNTNQTKELNLTHNLIADKAGFRGLMDIYDKDLILGYRDKIKKYIKENNINTDFSENTFEEVITTLTQGKTGKALNAVRPTAGMQTFIDDNPELYQTALGYNYGIFSKLYVDKDQLLDDKKQTENQENKKGSKRDNLIKHLFKIQSGIELYQSGEFNEFLRATDYRDKIRYISDKKTLKNNIEALVNVGEKTIEEVINDADEKGICLIDDRLENFKVKNPYLYDRVKVIRFSEFQLLYKYLEGKTPFSTQHKTKGTEFDNVLVILDNGGWNKYNFENMFLNTGTESVLHRTQKIFYVCCTRAKENLAVFYHDPSEAVIQKALEWFGQDNVIRL